MLQCGNYLRRYGIMFRKNEDDKANQYIREKVKQARLEANETQDDLAQVLEKNRVAISDLERGRVAASAADLCFISAHYGKPISYFFPPQFTITSDDLSPFEQELIELIRRLEDTQKIISLEYIRQQVKAYEAALGKMLAEDYLKAKTS